MSESESEVNLSLASLDSALSESVLELREAVANASGAKTSTSRRLTKRSTRGPKRTLIPVKEEDVEDQEDDHKENMEVDEDYSSKPGKRRKKRDALQSVTNAEEEQEGEHEDWDAVIEKACNVAKGYKMAIKHLYSSREVLLGNANESSLRRLVWNTVILCQPEGRRLVAYVILHLGIALTSRLILKRIRDHAITMTECTNYGEMLLETWKLAVKRDKQQSEEDDNEEYDENQSGLAKEVEEEIITRLVRLAISKSDKKAFQVLMSMASDCRGKVGGMLCRSVSPVLWRSLGLPRDQRRHSAACLFLRLFPVWEKEDSEPLDDQFEFMYKLLKDECADIRREAAYRVLVHTAQFETVFPAIHKKRLINCIIDELSNDRVATVRVAVLEGYKEILKISGALSALEQALSILVPRAINDRNDKVRLTALTLLRELRGHRFIRFFNVVSADLVMARLNVETHESVRSEIVRLVYPSYDLSHKLDESSKRMVHLLNIGRDAALSFHRLVFPLELVQLNTVVHHFRTLGMLIHWYAKQVLTSGGARNAQPDFEVDATMGSMNETIASLGRGQEQVEVDERSDDFVKCKCSLECLLVFWTTLRKALKLPENIKIRHNCDHIMRRLFERIFAKFRGTSLLGPGMLIGSLLPVSDIDKDETRSLSDLLQIGNAEEEVVEPYLDAVVRWRPEDILQVVANGLSELSAAAGEESKTAAVVASPARKKSKRGENKKKKRDDVIRTALHYLRFMMTSPVAVPFLVGRCRSSTNDFMEILGRSRDLIDAKLLPDEDDASLVPPRDGPLLKNLRLEESTEISGEVLLQAFQMSNALAVMLHTSTLQNDCNSQKKTSRRVKKVTIEESAVALSYQVDNVVSATATSAELIKEVTWIEDRLPDFLAIEDDSPRHQLMLQVVKIGLGHVDNMLSCFDILRSMRADLQESENNEGSRACQSSSPSEEDQSDITTYLDKVMNITQTVGKSSVVCHFLVQLAGIAEKLCAVVVESDGVADPLDQACYLALNIPRWLCRQCDSQPYASDPLTDKAIADSIVSMMRVLLKCTASVPATFPPSYITQMQNALNMFPCTLLRHLVKLNKEENSIADPRDDSFEVPRAVYILVHRVVFRLPLLLRSYTDCQSELLVELLTAGLSPSALVLNLGSLAQLALLADPAEQAARVASAVLRLASGTPSRRERMRMVTRELLCGIGKELMKLEGSPGCEAMLTYARELVPAERETDRERRERQTADCREEEEEETEREADRERRERQTADYREEEEEETEREADRERREGQTADCREEEEETEMEATGSGAEGQAEEDAEDSTR